MQRIIDTKHNITGERYATFDEFFTVNEARPLNDAYASVGDRQAMSPRDIREGQQCTWEETKHNVLFGSTCFTEEFERLRLDGMQQVQGWIDQHEAPKTRFDVVGTSVSVPRALAGHPRSSRRRVAVPRQRKTVDLLYSVTCPWRTPVETRLLAGVAVMCAAEALERVGNSVAVTLSPYFSFSGGHGPNKQGDDPSALLEIRAKDFRSRFNPLKMQFPLASGTVLFHMGCWWNHRHPGTLRDFGAGEGTTVDWDEVRKRDAVEYAHTRGAVYLSVPIIEKEIGFDATSVIEYILDNAPWL